MKSLAWPCEWNEKVSVGTQEVYFDDFKVTHVKSPVVSTDDYYPGGAMFNSYVRENSTLNNFKYQSKEFQTDLGLQLSDFGPRQYDGWILRTTTQDPSAEKFYPWSPYSWGFGNPVRMIDPSGMEPGDVNDPGILAKAVTTILNFFFGGSDDSSEEAASSVGRATEVNQAESEQAQDAKAELKATVDQIPVLNVIGDVMSAQQSKTPEEMAGNLAHAGGNLLLTPTGAGPGKGPRANTLEPGPFAGESIPARSQARDFNVSERTQMNEIGAETGCHTCGTTNAGTQSGNFIPDHQPPSALVSEGTPQQLYPQCASCSASQGGTVSGIVRKKNP